MQTLFLKVVSVAVGVLLPFVVHRHVLTAVEALSRWTSARGMTGGIETLILTLVWSSGSLVGCLFVVSALPAMLRLVVAFAYLALIVPSLFLYTLRFSGGSEF